MRHLILSIMDLSNILFDTVLISSNDIEPNNGQIESVPANPRKISYDKMESLKKSLQELPDMMSMRELLVYPLNDKYIVIAGNMRFKALLSLGCDRIPCKVIPVETPADKLRAIVIQDNNSFGKMDWDMIAEGWDNNELSSWGVDLPILESEIDIDKFFDYLKEEDTKKNNGYKLTIFIPDNYIEKKDDIKMLIETSLSKIYTGIKVK